MSVGMIHLENVMPLDNEVHLNVHGGSDNMGVCLLQILSLRTAIRDRDNEMKRFDNAWKDLQKELSTSRDEVARTKAELEAAKAVKVAQVKQYHITVASRNIYDNLYDTYK